MHKESSVSAKSCAVANLARGTYQVAFASFSAPGLLPCASFFCAAIVYQIFEYSYHGRSNGMVPSKHVMYAIQHARRHRPHTSQHVISSVSAGSKKRTARRRGQIRLSAQKLSLSLRRKLGSGPLYLVVLLLCQVEHRCFWGRVPSRHRYVATEGKSIRTLVAIFVSCDSVL